MANDIDWKIRQLVERADLTDTLRDVMRETLRAGVELFAPRTDVAPVASKPQICAWERVRDSKTHLARFTVDRNLAPFHGILRLCH